MQKTAVLIIVIGILLCVSATTRAYFEYPDLGPASPTPPIVTKPQPTPPVTKSEPKLRYTILRTRKVLRTVYYAPKKGQEWYYNGSYEKEVEMCGKGVFTSYEIPTRYGIVAADPKVFRKGTFLLITDPRDGIKKIFEVADTGPNVKGFHIDFFTGFGQEGLDLADEIGTETIVVQEVRVYKNV